MPRHVVSVRFKACLRFLTALLLLASLRATAADLPPALTGVWATADTEIDTALRGGLALYLDGAGRGALVAAPLPVRLCDGAPCGPRIGFALHAGAVAADGTVPLTFSQPDIPADAFRLRYEAAGPRLLLRAPDGEHVLLRRAAAVPPAIAAELR
jgi:hypothetical protein